MIADRMTRPPFERIKIIHDLLSADRYPNCTNIAAKLEVSSKSIQRDIEFMRDRLNLPIDFSRTHNGYYYSSPVSALPTVTMSDAEWQVLLIARKALAQYQGCPWSPQMGAALAKISSGFDDLLGSSSYESLLSFRNIGLASVNESVFTEVCQALFGSRELEFRFEKFSSARPDRRRVQPYHLSCTNGDWYLIGLNVDRGEVRVYALNRMRAVQTSKTKFTRPEKFSVNEFLGTTFGIRYGDSTIPMVLEFKPEAAWKVRQCYWHESQRIMDLPDGSLHLSLLVQPSRDLKAWILSWGHMVKVLRPSSLAEEVTKMAAGIIANY